MTQRTPGGGKRGRPSEWHPGARWARRTLFSILRNFLLVEKCLHPSPVFVPAGGKSESQHSDCPIGCPSCTSTSFGSPAHQRPCSQSGCSREDSWCADLALPPAVVLKHHHTAAASHLCGLPAVPLRLHPHLHTCTKLHPQTLQEEEASTGPAGVKGQIQKTSCQVLRPQQQPHPEEPP